MSHPHPGVRYGGRAANTPNKATVAKFAGVRSVFEICRENGKSPAEVLAETMRMNFNLAARYREANNEAIANNSREHVDRLQHLLEKACEPAYKLMEHCYAKLHRIDYVGDAPRAVAVENKMVVALRIGDKPSGDDDVRQTVIAQAEQGIVDVERAFSDAAFAVADDLATGGNGSGAGSGNVSSARDLDPHDEG